MLRTIRHILEMIRFSHTLFALPFALLAAVMAWTTPGLQTERRNDGETARHRVETLVAPSLRPSVPSSLRGSVSPSPPPFRWLHLAGILVCMVAARSAAMAFNRLADRTIDAENPRTMSRHLPAGILSTTSVALFTAGSAAAFVAGTLLFLPNRLPLWLSLPVLAFLLAYSYTKRFTALAHFWLGAALMLAPVSAWIALRGELVLVDPRDLVPAVVLGAAVLTWVAGFDMIYACQDADFDRRAKLKSLPATLGIAGSLRLAAACHLATLVLLAALPLVSPHVPLGWFYGSAVVVVAVLLVGEHSLVRPDDLSRVNLAFFNINAIISLGLFVAGTIDLVT
jgi:4-hydroxybenzoate polyprenyltransferase